MTKELEQLKQVLDGMLPKSDYDFTPEQIVVRTEHIIREQGERIRELEKKFNCEEAEAGYWYTEYHRLLNGSVWNFIKTKFKN